MTEVIVIAIALLLVLAVVSFVMFETAVVIDPGTIALVLRRGKATDRVLTPGRHFVEPWRKVVVQTYPSRELSLIAGGRSVDDPRVEFSDDPLRVHLGDKSFAELSYTVRCQLDTARLKDVHDLYGPEGIWAALRDTTRRALLGEIGAGGLSIDDGFGDRFTALERRLAAALDTALGEVGFRLKMFSLRELDLGETGEVIQDIVRADVELQREQAFAKVRAARLENDAAVGSLLEGIDGDLLLRYRQIEAWRDLLHRWDGDQAIPSALTVPLLATSASTGPGDAQQPAPDESSEPASEQP